MRARRARVFREFSPGRVLARQDRQRLFLVPCTIDNSNGFFQNCRHRTEIQENVRRKYQPRLIGVEKRTGLSRLANSTEDPFRHAIDHLVSTYLKPESNSTLEEKIEGHNNLKNIAFMLLLFNSAAVESIGHFSWTGGLDVAEYIGKKYMFLLVSMISDEASSDTLKLIVKSVSEICYGLKQNQELARELSLLTIMIEYAASTGIAENRKWCLHALFFILCENPENQRRAVEDPKFRTAIHKGMVDSWSGWDHNEALELKTLIDS